MSEEPVPVMPASRDRLGELAGPAMRALDTLDASVWELAPDPAILELCRTRIAGMLGASDAQRRRTPAAAGVLEEEKVAALDDWETSPRFDQRERAYLEFTEQFVTSVRHLEDSQIDALCRHDSPADVCAFVAALYVLEITQRADLVSATVLA
jgi:alkylhydroperoxidase family enzyme